MIATTLATMVLAVASGGPDEPQPCQTQACHRRVTRKHWRATTRPYRGWLHETAACESRNRWHLNTGNGFYGGLQFALPSWRAVDGTGYPHEASILQQMYRGVKLLRIQGRGAWPVCG